MTSWFEANTKTNGEGKATAKVKLSHLAEIGHRCCTDKIEHVHINIFKGVFILISIFLRLAGAGIYFLRGEFQNTCKFGSDIGTLRSREHATVSTSNNENIFEECQNLLTFVSANTTNVEPA